MSCVVFGAGKIARGFVGHILHLSGIPFVFVEKYKPLVDLINERGQYTVNVLGNEEKNAVVDSVRALSYEDKAEIVAAIAAADVVFTAVGGKNLEQLVPFLTEGIREKLNRHEKLNVITCENWKLPADIIKNNVLQQFDKSEQDAVLSNIGFTEAVIMRSGIEPNEEQKQLDPLTVNVSNFWEMPLDGDRLVCPLPAIECVKPMTGFAGFLERKFYTYNVANGTTSFVGALLGYQCLSDAAWDPRIIHLLNGIYLETSLALCTKHGIPLADQLAFTETSRRKLQDVQIVDTIERNARDPMRKLGPDDRLVGSARLVESCGIKPENVAVAIACALFYKSDNEEDASAKELAQLRKTGGVDAILTQVCKLDLQEPLALLVKEKIELIRAWGWID